MNSSFIHLFSRASLCCSRLLFFLLLLSVAITRPCPGAVHLQRSAVSSALPIHACGLRVPIVSSFTHLVSRALLFPSFCGSFYLSLGSDTIRTAMPWHSPSRAIGWCPVCCFSAPVVNVHVLLASPPSHIFVPSSRSVSSRRLLLLFAFTFFSGYFGAPYLLPCPGVVHLPRSADVQRVAFSSPVVNVRVLLLTVSPFFVSLSLVRVLFLFVLRFLLSFRIQCFPVLMSDPCINTSWCSLSTTIGCSRACYPFCACNSSTYIHTSVLES